MSFDAAVAYVNSSTGGSLDTETKLTFYKLYKQATVGDCATAQPGLLDMTGRAKWKAWKSVEGMSPEKAKELYVATLTEKVPQWNQ